MYQEKVDVEVFALDIEVVLAAIEGESPAELGQRLGHPLGHGLLHGQFFDFLGQAEEIEDQRILGNTPCQRGAAAVARPGIGEDGANWIVSKDPGIVLWDFHDARNNARGSLEVHNLIWAIGLALVDNCLLGPAVAALKEAGTSTGLLVVAPPAIHRSTGVLINPLLLY